MRSQRCGADNENGDRIDDSSRNEREVSISSVVPRWVSPGGTHLLM